MKGVVGVSRSSPPMPSPSASESVHESKASRGNCISRKKFSSSVEMTSLVTRVTTKSHTGFNSSWQPMNWVSMAFLWKSTRPPGLRQLSANGAAGVPYWKPGWPWSVTSCRAVELLKPSSIVSEAFCCVPVLPSTAAMMSPQPSPLKSKIKFQATFDPYGPKLFVPGPGDATARVGVPSRRMRR